MNTTTQQPRVGANVDPDIPDEGRRAAEITAKYAKIYDKRSAKSDHGEAFTASEQNGLAAFFISAHALRLGRDSEQPQALALLDRLTGSVLEHERSHTAASDIAGYAWAMSYGTLPLENPPHTQLEWVLKSGSANGAIRGAYASGWRALFLEATTPLLRWTTRGSAEQQATRWLTYATSKFAGLAGQLKPATEAGPASQSARLAFVAGSLGRITGDASLTEHACALLDSAVGGFADDGCPLVAGERLVTAHCAQIALAAHATGNAAVRDRTVHFLLEHRVNESSGVLAASDDTTGRAELSPWAPLGLLPSAESLVSRRRSGRRLRSLLGRAG